MVPQDLVILCIGGGISPKVCMTLNGARYVKKGHMSHSIYVTLLTILIIIHYFCGTVLVQI